MPCDGGALWESGLDKSFAVESEVAAPDTNQVQGKRCRKQQTKARRPRITIVERRNMLIGDIHRWLGKASGGTGPVFRWVWASLIVASGTLFVYLVTIAVA